MLRACSGVDSKPSSMREVLTRRSLIRWGMILLTPLLAAGSCESVDNGANVRSGRCILTKAIDPFLCIDFSNDSNSNFANEICEEESERYQISHGATGHDYLSGTSSICDQEDLAGSCGTEYGFIRFYSDHWTAASAESACLTFHDGEWAAF